MSRKYCQVSIEERAVIMVHTCSTICREVNRNWGKDRYQAADCRVTTAKQLSIDNFFADPYSLWQRGSNKNT